MIYCCDEHRHLVCVPYSVENLHLMAADLGIGRHWFHAHPRHPHYDIPKGRVAEVRLRCVAVRPRDILAIVGGTWVAPGTTSG